MGFLAKLFGTEQQRADGRVPTLTYRVGVNETCRALAKKFYGDEAQWERVYADNERVIKDDVQTSTDPLLPGTEVTIKGAKYDLDGQPIDSPSARAMSTR